MSGETGRVVRYWVAPRYVREAFGEAADPVRSPGGGWVNRVTGAWLEAMRWDPATFFGGIVNATAVAL